MIRFYEKQRKTQFLFHFIFYFQREYDVKNIAQL